VSAREEFMDFWIKHHKIIQDDPDSDETLELLDQSDILWLKLNDADKERINSLIASYYKINQ
jgi:hypothetical protein